MKLLKTIVLEEDYRMFGAPKAMAATFKMARGATMFDTEEEVETPQVRKEFPETWLWEDIET